MKKLYTLSILIYFTTMFQCFSQWILSDSGMSNPGAVTSLKKFKNLILASTYFQTAFYSMDTGYNWEQVQGLPINTYVRDIGTSDNSAFIMTDAGIYKSLDGIHWKSYNANLPTQNGAYFSVFHSEMLAGINGSLYLSKDEGATWGVISSKLGGDVFITERLYIAHLPELSARKKDNPQGNWINITSGLDTTERNFTFDTINNILIAIGNRGALYKLDESKMQWEKLSAAFLSEFSHQTSLTHDKNFLYFGSNNSGRIGAYYSKRNPIQWEPFHNGLGSFANSLLVLDTLILAGGYKSPGIYRRTLVNNLVTSMGAELDLDQIIVINNGDVFKIQNNTNIRCEYTLITAQGVVIYRDILNCSEQIQMSIPSKGVYFIKLHNLNEFSVRKFFIE